MSQTSERPDPRLETLQAVYDRVQSYEESATPEQIRSELDRALAKAGLDVSDETRQRLADHIHGGGGHEDVAGLLA
ncbi:MAG: hypothetical protein ABIQ15_00050 [Nocardioides sp.]